MAGCSTEAMTNIGGDDDGGFGFTVSNVDVGSLDFSNVGDVQIGDEKSIYTDLGGLLPSSNGGASNYQVIQQSNGLSLGVFTVQSLEIQANATVHASGVNGLVIVALDDITIDGKLNADSRETGVLQGAGAGEDDTPEDSGNGLGGGGAGGVARAGAGGSFCGIGGDGGGNDGTSPSIAPAPYGSPELSPLVAGSQGGNGQFGTGGRGGGAIQLVAGGTITVTGSVSAGGKGGEGSGQYANGASQTAGGAGAGGAILLEAHAISVGGSLSVNGGGGGGKGYGDDAMPGSIPAAGAIAGDDKMAGGDGGAATLIDGAPGQNGTATTAGGGGGGAGRIRFNTHTGAASITGTLSPSASTECVTQGLTR
ncbi:MAG: hypothetical protein QM831_08130 [Kofleriaceae bacterium]